jgi:hypothetical protein
MGTTRHMIDDVESALTSNDQQNVNATTAANQLGTAVGNTKRIIANSVSVSMLGMENEVYPVTCQFKRVCKLYSLDSYTCSHEGGEYCGRYRELSNAKRELIA